MKVKVLNWRIACIALTFPLFVGCATMVSQPILEADRDTTNAFEGRWVGVANSGKCSDNEWNRQIRVQKGAISMVHQGAVEKTFLNQEGQFRLEAGESILVGSLGAGKGKWTDADVSCTVNFERE